jgi:SAM-dependent methyltransferase
MALELQFTDLKSSFKSFIKGNFPELARRTFDTFHLSPDRLILEEEIFPYFINRIEFQKILFVGCEWYTKPYNKYFKNKEYWTIEINPKKAKYGAKQHIIDSITNLSESIENNYFDLIIFNGVFHLGDVDKKDEAERAFQQCYQTLKNGGIFIVGWNDTEEILPFPLTEIDSLSQFQPYIFPALGKQTYLTRANNRHTYSFYIKRDIV